MSRVGGRCPLPVTGAGFSLWLNALTAVTSQAAKLYYRRRQRLVERDLPQQRQIRQHPSRADDDRGQRILGHENGKARFVAKPLVEVTQQRAAAGEDDAAVEDVSGKLWRHSLERVANRLDDETNRLGQRVADVAVAKS